MDRRENLLHLLCSRMTKKKKIARYYYSHTNKKDKKRSTRDGKDENTIKVLKILSPTKY